MPSSHFFRVLSGLATVVIVTVASMAAWGRSQPATPLPASFEEAERAFARGNFTAAIPLYERARDEGIDHAMLHSRLGYSLHVTGKVGEALPHYLRGVAMNNRAVRISCIYNAACAHAVLGHAEDSLRYLRYAIDAGYDNTAEVRGDPDFASLRDDDRFKALIDGIGVQPTLFEQLDFMVGLWHLDGGEGMTTTYRFERPIAESSAMTYQVSSPGRFAWVGSMVPNPVDRTWELVYCNGIGTTYRMDGTFEGEGVTFRGRGEDVGGTGVLVAVTFEPGPEGTLVEHARVCEDGQTWREHHRVVLHRLEDAMGSAGP